MVQARRRAVGISVFSPILRGGCPTALAPSPSRAALGEFTPNGWMPPERLMAGANTSRGNVAGSRGLLVRPRTPTPSAGSKARCTPCGQVHAVELSAMRVSALPALALLTRDLHKQWSTAGVSLGWRALPIEVCAIHASRTAAGSARSRKHCTTEALSMLCMHACVPACSQHSRAGAVVVGVADELVTRLAAEEKHAGPFFSLGASDVGLARS